MARSLGSIKTGGRQKGTPNKATQQFRAVLEGVSISPIGEVARLLPLLTPKEQIDVHLSLLPYLYPKRKPQEEASGTGIIETLADLLDPKKNPDLLSGDGLQNS